YTLEYVSPPEEQVCYNIYAARAENADVLISTHAALIRDLSFPGGYKVLDPNGHGFSLVVMDEAHRLEQAGALALGTRRALSSLIRERELLMPIAAKIQNTTLRSRLSELAFAQVKLGEELLAAAQAIGEQRFDKKERD